MVLLLVLGIALVAIDQATKSIALKFLEGEPSTVLVDGFLSFTYVENRGAAFGIFDDSRYFLLIVSCILIVVLIYLLVNSEKLFESKLSKLFITLTLAGAIGNMIDRVFVGYVIDFIHVTFVDFPVFNFADICVVCGSTLLMIVSLKD